jgi:hypothetical protein
LEDQRREMDSNQEEVPAVRGSSLNPRELTVMVIRSVGKIHSFKVSRRIILWTSIFFLAYILTSLIIFNRFFDLRYRYNLQSEKLGSLESDLNKNGKSLLQTKQYVAGLEDYIKSLREQKGQQRVTAQKKKVGSVEVDRIAKDLDKGNEEKTGQFKVVDIQDIIIKKENSGMSVDFKLVNTRSEENAAEGYVHIIAMNQKNECPPEWNYPHDKLQDGIPVNFRRGQPFLIQRFKPYYRQFNMNPNSELPTAIKVLVYDRSGKLILKKEFEVSDAS